MPLPKRKSAVDAVLKWTRRGLDLGQQVALLVPIPAYGPISQVLIKLIDQIADARTNKRDAEDVLQDIQILAEIVGKSKEELDSRTALLSTTDQRMLESRFLASSGLPGRFGQFYNDLKDLEVLSEGLHHKWYLPRFLFSDNDADIIQDIRDGVSKAKTFFETRCQVVIQEYLQAIDGRLAEVQSTINHVETVVVGAEVARKMEADNRTLESLPHADASYRASINELKSRFLEGTRSSLFAELEKWIDSDLSNSSICVLSGGAGTGKSTVASELARRLDCCHGKLGASFFFARGVTDLDSTRVFFPTIAYQLAHWTEGTLRQPIIDAAREHLSKGRTQAMAYEAPALLHAPLDRADKQNPIFVVVDALDECTQDAYTLVPEMLNLLMTSTKHGPLRIFLTFRSEQLIESQLLSPQWSSVIHTIYIDTFSDDAIRDVAAFIRARFSGMGVQGVALLRQRPEDANRLAARAQGLFIYARTAMDFLETYPGTLEEGVNILLSEEEEGVTLGTLDQLYLTVLVSAFPADHMHHLRPRARVQSILACIALLRNPMTPSAVESLTSLTRTPITCQDMEIVLDRLCSVVIFKRGEPDEVFRPMHATFPQFLVDSARCTNALFLVHPRHHHARLAEACLEVLLSLEKNMCKLDDSALDASIGDIADLQDRLALIPQHVRYACVHWAAHLREACRPQEHHEQACFCRNLVRLLERFVSERMLRWLEVLALMGRVDGAMDDLTAARDWLPPDAHYDPLRASIDHGRQILFNHTDDIRECPHSVYCVEEQPGSSPLPVLLTTNTDKYGNYVNFSFL